MILTALLVSCAVNMICYAHEGDSCTKDGVPGVCTDLKHCPGALQDIQNKKRPQHCVFGTRNAIVCCVSPVTTSTTTERPQKCVLPPYPEHGNYTANVGQSGSTRVSPGEAHNFFVLDVTCEPGYSMDGPQVLFCRDGWWPEKMSNCISQSCTKGETAGVCTKLNQCPAAREDIKNRIAPQHCWFGGVDPIVCCVPLPSVGTTTTTPVPTTTTKRTQVSNLVDTHLSNDIDKRGKEERCDPLPEFLSPKPTGQKAWDKCLEYQDKLIFPCSKSETQGYSRSNRCHHHPDIMVTGAGTAEPYEFPHAGLLGFEEAEGLKWLCVGSLISEKFVLTAAHCTNSLLEGEVKYVQLGVLRRSALPEKDRYRVRRIIRHPEHSSPMKYNDIALLELEKSVALDEFIVPACLVTGTPVDDSLAVFTGWGGTALDEKPSEYLKKLVLSKYESQECAASYQPSRHMKNGIDNRSQVCYGDKSTFTNICSGDSGGPLQIKNKQISCMYSVIGVASFGKMCGGNTTSYYPDIYTRVAPYLDWIEATVWPTTPVCVP